MIIDIYSDSLKKSDEMWRQLSFSHDKPMKVSRCYMEVDGISLDEYMNMIMDIQVDEFSGVFRSFQDLQHLQNTLFPQLTLVKIRYLESKHLVCTGLQRYLK